jgi:hypothetical protein
MPRVVASIVPLSTIEPVMVLPAMLMPVDAEIVPLFEIPPLPMVAEESETPAPDAAEMVPPLLILPASELLLTTMPVLVPATLPAVIVPVLMTLTPPVWLTVAPSIEMQLIEDELLIWLCAPVKASAQVWANAAGAPPPIRSAATELDARR